jgi:hypothetical protein
MTTNPIIDRIRKLLALADASRNPNEAEAEAAMRMATRLLSQNNLDLSDVTTDHDPNNQPVGEHPVPCSRAPAETWKAILANSTAPLYYAKVYRHGDELRYVGRPHNTIVASEMTAYLIRAIDRLAEQALASAMFSARPPKNDALFLRSFREGATSRLYHRIAEMIKERDTAPIASSTGTTLPALAASELALVDDYLQAKNLSKARRSARKTDQRAYFQGNDAATTIGLHSQVSAAPHGAALRLA